MVQAVAASFSSKSGAKRGNSNEHSTIISRVALPLITLLTSGSCVTRLLTITSSPASPTTDYQRNRRFTRVLNEHKYVSNLVPHEAGLYKSGMGSVGGTLPSMVCSNLCHSDSLWLFVMLFDQVEGLIFKLVHSFQLNLLSSSNFLCLTPFQIHTRPLHIQPSHIHTSIHNHT